MGDAGGQVPRPPGFQNPPPPGRTQIPGRPPPHLPAAFRPTKKGSSCCKICCCTILLIIILILLLLIITGGLFYLYHPKVPSFNVKSFKASALTLTPKPEGTYFSAGVSASVQVTNPNDKLTYRYGETHVGITLGEEKDTDMGSTTLPPFEQDGKKTTSLKVETSVKDQLLDKKEEERLPKQYKDKSLVVNLDIKSAIGVELVGLKLGMMSVEVTCDGMTLKEIESGRSPACTIQALNRMITMHTS
ncbi:NDR1/HIN1-like protein 13 [Linum grandiflorum]